MAEHGSSDRPARRAYIAERGEIERTIGTRQPRIKHTTDDDGHYWQGRESLAGEQPKQVAGKNQIVQVKRRSHEQGLPKLVQTVVEIQREHTCNPIGRFRPEIARHNPGAVGQISLCYYNALGPTCGS